MSSAEVVNRSGKHSNDVGLLFDIPYFAHQQLDPDHFPPGKYKSIWSLWAATTEQWSA
jgi:hypothetical protein